MLVDTEKVISISKAARLAGYTQQYMWTLMRDKKVKSYKVADRPVLDKESVLSYARSKATRKVDMDDLVRKVGKKPKL